MTCDPNRYHRRSIRLKGYDYSQAGAYFVTICTQDRACLFGDVVDGEIRMNEAGRTAERCWLDIPNHFPYVALGTVVIMPNHVHGIIVITHAPQTTCAVNMMDRGGEHGRGERFFAPTITVQSPSKTIGSVVRGFKIGVTKWFRVNTNLHHIWQRNYYEHIIRNEEFLNRIRQYILDNPLRWGMDRENPAATEMESENTWLT